MLYHTVFLFWLYGKHFPLLFDISNIAIFTGWLSLGGIVVVLPFAFFRRQIPYRRWRFIHLATNVCLITALIHLMLILAPQRLEEWILFIFISIAAIFSLFFSVILPISPSWGKKYVITRLEEIRPNLFLLQLNTNKGKQHLHYEPGHFIYLKFLSMMFSNSWHPFTIISKPSEPYIELFIKSRGKDTSQLKSISLPACVRLLAPFGTPFWRKDQPQLWISYGIGVAIFLAAVRSFPYMFKQKIHFICCDSSQMNIFFKHELDQCMHIHPNFTWEIYIGSGYQFVSDFKLKSTDFTHFKSIRICGHPGFQNTIRATLISKGVRKKIIQLEGLL